MSNLKFTRNLRLKWAGNPFAAVSTVILLFAVCITVGWPVLQLVVASFKDGSNLGEGNWTFKNYAHLFTNESLPLLLNTLIYATFSTGLALVVGVLLAWLVTRTDIPLKRLWEQATLAIYFVPLLIAAVAWGVLFSPRIGIVNSTTQDLFSFILLDIYSLHGMIIVGALYKVPIIYLFVAAGFRAMSPEIEEASRVSGAGPIGTLFRISLGANRPNVLSSAVVCFILAIGSVEIPLIFGYTNRVFVLTSDIFTNLRINYPPDYGRAAALSTLLVAASLIALWFNARLIRKAHRFATVTGKGQKNTDETPPVRLSGFGKTLATCFCAAFFLFAIVLPLIAIIIQSFLPFAGRFTLQVFERMSLGNYRELFESAVFLRSVRNSIQVSTIAGVIVVAIGTLIAYVVVRYPTRASRGLDYLASTPLALPGIVKGFALLIVFIAFPVPIYGTLTIIGLAYIVMFLPISLRQMTGPVHQISNQLEEASRVSGAGSMRTFFVIAVPLLRIPMISAFILAFVFFIREFSASVLLYVNGTETLAVVMYDYYSNGRIGAFAAISTMMLFSLVLLYAVIRLLSNFKYRSS